MIPPPKPIPDWYQGDWTPCSGRGEMPQISWEDLETVLDQLASTPARKTAALRLFEHLKAASPALSPMDLLQQIILCASTVMSQPPMLEVSPPRRRLSGRLPRWSYTDVEVALSCSTEGQALQVAFERHRDLIANRGLGSSGRDALRSIFLIAFGLGSPRTSARKTRKARPETVETRARRAA